MWEGLRNGGGILSIHQSLQQLSEVFPRTHQSVPVISKRKGCLKLHTGKVGSRKTPQRRRSCTHHEVFAGAHASVGGCAQQRSSDQKVRGQREPMVHWCTVKDQCNTLW